MEFYMKIDEHFIELVLTDFTLNKTQCEILSLPFPLALGWDSLVLEKEISRDDANLLILLKGHFPVKTQEQIIENYRTMLEFNLPESTITQKEEPKSIQTIENNSAGNMSIYCDGACSGNPGEAGSGIAVYYDDKKPVLLYGDYVKNGTNNIAELNALYQALILCEKSNSSNKITIFSDSKYSINCISIWAYGWKANSWTKKGGEIKNLDIVKAAHELFDSIKERISIKHVKGHSGIQGNELADRMAVNTIKTKNTDYKEYTYDNIDDVLALTSY